MAHTAPENTLRATAARLAACLVTIVAILFAAAVPATASRGADRTTAQSSSLKKKRAKRRAAKRRHRRHLRVRARRAQVSRAVSLAPNAPVGRRKARVATTSTDSDLLDAGCDGSLLNWNTAGVGEAIPTPATDTVRSGTGSCRVALEGTQHRSELILGGNGGGSTSGMVEFDEGDEYWYAFSFYIDKMTYGRPGAHNLIMQFKGDDDGSPAFGLQLWDYEGDDEEYEANPRGLWSHGPSMGGDRFLALAPEQTWHDVVIHFRASAVDDGFYEVYLDGNLVDSRSGVSMIADGADYAYIKNGLYRNGDEIPGDSEIRLDAARLGSSLSAVSPS